MKTDRHRTDTDPDVTLCVRLGNARYAWVFGVMFGLFPAYAYNKYGLEMFRHPWGWIVLALPLVFFIRSLFAILERGQLRLTGKELRFERQRWWRGPWRCVQKIPRPDSARAKIVPRQKEKWPDIQVFTDVGSIRWGSESPHAFQDIERTNAFLENAGIQMKSDDEE